MKKISIVIPIYNEDQFINGLLESIENIDYPKDQYEVIVVSDGSTDNTVEVVKKHPQVRLIELLENVGRYHARRTGAEAACFPNILFVDSRSVVDSGILAALDQTDARAVNGYSLGKENLGPFEIFYRSIRRIVFYRFYRSYNKPIWITGENFEFMPKGTTVLYAEKEVLFKAYAQLSHLDMGKDSSDDTKLLRKIVDQVPLLLHPGVKIINFARPSFRKSVKHLFDRGIKFVDYYLNPSLSKFWSVIVFPLLALAVLLIALILLPVSAWSKLAALAILNLLATIVLARSLREFGIVLYMLPLCAFVFYSGILRGIILKFRKSAAVSGAKEGLE